MKYLFTILLILIYLLSYTQTITKTISGRVYDNVSHKALSGASVRLVSSKPQLVATTDADGIFTLMDVPVGRQTIQINKADYEPFIANDLMVTSGKDLMLTIEMQKSTSSLETIVVKVAKNVPLNSMTTLSSRQFSVEETQRYAGGLDDPARLASSFAGVATPSVSSNSISVRGNAPDGLLWKIEGVEVPNPNHFANLTVIGGGLLTAVSNQLMANSDFYTGAFPAEYGNALSGVFDIKLSAGNTSKRRYTFQAGVLGIDLGSQGPYKTGKQASYNINYRYSTMGLVSPLLPDNTGVLKYQDLSFKTAFPIAKAGILSIWGIGALDVQKMNAARPEDWESDDDRDNSRTAPNLYASGISYKSSLNECSYLKSSIAISGDGLAHDETRLDDDLNEYPQSKIHNSNRRLSFQSVLDHRFSNSHQNRTGFVYSQLNYKIDSREAVHDDQAMKLIAQQKGHTQMLQFFSQSKLHITARLVANLGINTQYFHLTKELSVEPRIGFSYLLTPKHRIALAYGLNSRINQLPIYFINQDGTYPNKNLKLMKSAHYVLAYNWQPTNYFSIQLEPYFQQLNSIPVSTDSYVSTINIENDQFFNEELVSKGKAKNIGIDLTVERHFYKHFYYLFTASVFDAKYTPVDGIERNTQFNKNYVFNGLAGKEWSVGPTKNHSFGLNIRLNYLGGNRAEPVNESASLEAKEVVFSETDQHLAYEKKFKDTPVFSFTIQYRKNKAHYSAIWSLQVLNALNAKDFSNYTYNLKTQKIQTNYEGICIPNLSYKIEF